MQNPISQSQGADPQAKGFREDVLAGLREPPKALPSKYLYDARGSQLFDQICALDEYYPTRVELSIMERFAGQMAARLGERCLIAEYGSGSSLKTRHLLDHLVEPAGYVPVDISEEHLLKSAQELAALYPDVEVLPVCADFTRAFEAPPSSVEPARTAVYFPGSTIGNFNPTRAADLLVNIVDRCGEDGALLIGVDGTKDGELLERAYDDDAGVTAAFNLNLLQRMNRELDANFRIDRFAHRAVYNRRYGRVEMHLVSTEAQTVDIDGTEITFERDETICTEHSHKYSIEEFHAFAEPAGLTPEAVWTDDDSRFAVLMLKVA